MTWMWNSHPTLVVKLYFSWHIPLSMKRTYLKLPWRSLISIDGTTFYELDEKFTIVRHAESWNVSALEAIDDFDEQEQVLRQFDMNMAYGPCLGITRLARLERAQRLGLSPSKEIENLLKGGKVKLECLFDGRV
ncbi:hypothetical protein CRYUN_Cryun05aG0052800 [Craigia yunnanensis]